jgi:hypothetical protein
MKPSSCSGLTGAFLTESGQWIVGRKKAPEGALKGTK